MNSKSILTSAIIGVLLMLLLPFWFDTFTLTILLIYSLLALSLGLIWGFGGILCFGQAAYFGLGAYAYAIAAINFGESTMPFLIGIFVPFVVSGLLGMLIFYGRVTDVYLGVITLVVTLLLFKYINATAGAGYVIGEARLGGFNGIPNFQTLNIPGQPEAYIYGDAYYYFCAIVVLGIYLLCRALLVSRFGRIIIGIRENEQRSELNGIDARLYKTILFSIGGAIAGLAGVLYANWAEIVTPKLFSLPQTAEIIIWCLVGGVGTLFGPIIGAVLLVSIKFLLASQSVVDNTLVLGLILVLFVLFLPKGIIPAITDSGWGKRRRSKKGQRTKRGIQ